MNDPVSLGWKRIVIFSPYSQPFEIRRFIWYGANDLGTVNLERSTVSFRLDVRPPPDSIELWSSVATVGGSNRTFTNVPAGRYVATLKYGTMVDTQTVDVTRNVPSIVSVKAGVGMLNLISEPPDASFTLVALKDRERMSASFPIITPTLRAGEYRLLAKRGEYERELTVTVLGGETNDVLVKFPYGSLDIQTEPSGAAVMIGGKGMGISPLLLTNLIPGKQNVLIQRDGFDPISTQVGIEEGKTARMEVHLVSTRYRQAMEDARIATNGRRFRDALRLYQSALEAKPNDPVANEILPSARADAFREEVEAFLTQGDFEGAKRALDQAEATGLKDPSTTEIRARLSILVADRERKRAEALASQALLKAREAIASHDFDEATSQIQAARAKAPEFSAISEVEREVVLAKARWEESKASEAKAEEVLKRQQELDAAFSATLSKDRAPEVFPTGKWRTTKSLQEIKTALDTISRTNKGLKISEEASPNERTMSLKMGNLTPVLNIGRYVRVSAGEVAENQRELRVKVLVFGAEAGKLGTEPVVAESTKTLGELRTALTLVFRGDLK